MNSSAIQKLLADLANGSLSIPEAMARLRALPFEPLAGANVDHHRSIRCGHAEVIFCPGKPPDQVVEIARRIRNSGDPVLATRASPEQMRAVRLAFADAIVNETGRVIRIGAAEATDPIGPPVAIVSAGTSDAAVAEEALATLQSFGAPVQLIQDVGISGLHRLLSHVPMLQKCCAIVAIAGMEGALPSVVGGLVACPVFAVPTSIGYGVSLTGLAALLAMLNSCASNVTVTNIDNGFGAAYSAGLVWRQVVAHRTNSLKD